jgi:hypothetical protein
MATNISNNTFTGIKWNKSSIQTVQTVAQALLNITEVFKAQNIKFTLLKVEREVEGEFAVGSNGSFKFEETDKTTDSNDGTEVEPPLEET